MLFLPQLRNPPPWCPPSELLRILIQGMNGKPPRGGLHTQMTLTMLTMRQRGFTSGSRRWHTGWKLCLHVFTAVQSILLQYSTCSSPLVNWDHIVERASRQKIMSISLQSDATNFQPYTNNLHINFTRPKKNIPLPTSCITKNPLPMGCVTKRTRHPRVLLLKNTEPTGSCIKEPATLGFL